MKHVGNVQKPITFVSLSAAIANFLLTFNNEMEKKKKEKERILAMCRLEVLEWE